VSGHWNYRITREKVPAPEGGEMWLYALREVHYDAEGNVRGWTADPVEFVGDTPGEVADSLARAAGCFASGVLDLETRETVRTSLSGVEVSR
jgi:hypothetical protein